MKTLIKTLAFTCLSLSLASHSFGADKTKAEKMEEKAAEKAAEMNHIAMKDGKVIVMKDGETSALEKEVTLMDGTKVMADGSYMEKGDGKKKMLKEGDAITWKGKVTDHAKLMKDIQKDMAKAEKDAAKDKEKADKEAAKEKK